MAEGIDTSALGQIKMWLNDEVKKRKFAIEALHDIEVFEQIDNRLGKMVKEDKELKGLIANNKEELSRLDEAVSIKSKEVQAQVRQEQARLGKVLEDYKVVAARETENIKNDQAQAQADYTSMKEGLDTELKDMRDQVQVAKKELQDTEGARDSVRRSIGDMARTVGV